MKLGKLGIWFLISHARAYGQGAGNPWARQTALSRADGHPRDRSAIARAIGRRVLGHSTVMPNYRASFLRMGFTEEDLENSGSDRFIDSIVAWGDEDAIRRRIQEHWDAGADQVCIQTLPKETMRATEDDLKIFELLAPVGGE